MWRTGLRARLAGGAAVAAALLASGAAAGCSASVAPASTTVRSVSGRGPITFATGTVGSGYVPGLIRKWNAEHPCRHVTAAHPCQRVTVLYLPKDSDEQYSQLVENLQAKSDVYDVMNLDVVWTAEFASNGWITPVSEKKVPLGSFLQPAVDTAMYEHKLYAVPFTSNAGLLYYRKDLVKTPPRTWAQLAYDARTIAPANHIGGYAGQFEDYEGLTVNFAEAVQSAGGSILSPSGNKATLNTPQAHEALSFLVNGFRQGWIPAASLGYDEDASRDAFVAGHLLFLRNWPYMYGYASETAPGHVVAHKFGVTTLPGPNGPGSSTLGGANLAISAYSQHPETALAFIQFLTRESSQRQVLIKASQPPVWTRLYNDPALIRRYPYLPVLKRAILAARPRPEIASYNQLSLAISSAIHRALARQVPVNQTLVALNDELNQIVKNG